MTREKRAKLLHGGSSKRGTKREAVAIQASCTLGNRAAERVLVTDLGLHGCRMHTSAVGVTRAEELVLEFAGRAPVRGTLAWIKGGALGVRFTDALSQEDLNTLCREESADNIVPIRS